MNQIQLKELIEYNPDIGTFISKDGRGSRKKGTILGTNENGYFKTAKEAGKAYNEGAIKYFGEFARVNSI
jgi:hypothetical protein